MQRVTLKFTREEFLANGYINTTEAAKYIGIGKNLLSNMTKEEVIKAVYTCNEKGQFDAAYYKKTELDKLIEARKKFADEYYSAAEFNKLVLSTGINGEGIQK